MVEPMYRHEVVETNAKINRVGRGGRQNELTCTTRQLAVETVAAKTATPDFIVTPISVLEHGK
jgi:hypothetical protein